MDLSGNDCNKVGVNFAAFKFQPGKCYKEIES